MAGNQVCGNGCCKSLGPTPSGDSLLATLALGNFVPAPPRFGHNPLAVHLSFAAAARLQPLHPCLLQASKGPPASAVSAALQVRPRRWRCTAQYLALLLEPGLIGAPGPCMPMPHTPVAHALRPGDISSWLPGYRRNTSLCAPKPAHPFPLRPSAHLILLLTPTSPGIVCGGVCCPSGSQCSGNQCELGPLSSAAWSPCVTCT
jgi:hypothetical protein